jgi:hypothetical protein
MVADDWGPYSISSLSGAWGPRYLYDAGDVDGLQFNQVGDYSYYDAFNYNYGVVHVRVGVPNTPPTVSITGPADGALFAAPATFTFSANATDSDSGISDVEFYVGADFADDIFASPFSTTITDLGPGSYTLQVVAYDLGGASSSSTISIIVKDSSVSGIALSAPRVIGGQFRFDVSGLTPGTQLVLESSTTLGASANWTRLETNVVNAASTSFTRSVGPGNHFFRVETLP